MIATLTYAPDHASTAADGLIILPSGVLPEVKKLDFRGLFVINKLKTHTRLGEEARWHSQKGADREASSPGARLGLAGSRVVSEAKLSCGGRLPFGQTTSVGGVFPPPSGFLKTSSEVQGSPVRLLV